MDKFTRTPPIPSPKNHGSMTNLLIWQGESHVTEAMWAPPMWSGARNISVGKSKGSYVAPNSWLLFSSGRAWNTSSRMKSPPPSTHESWIKKKIKLSPSLKGIAEEMMPTGGSNSYLFILKGRTKGVNHQLQAHVRNSIGNLGNPMGTFKSHTNALIRWDEQSTPSSCKHWFFIHQ